MEQQTEALREMKSALGVEAESLLSSVLYILSTLSCPVISSVLSILSTLFCPVINLSLGVRQSWVQILFEIISNTLCDSFPVLMDQ